MTIQHLFIMSPTTSEIVESNERQTHVKPKDASVMKREVVKVYRFDNKNYLVAIGCTINSNEIEQQILKSGISPIE